MNRSKKISTLLIGIVFPTLLFMFSPMWTSLFESDKRFEYELKYLIELSNRISGLEKWEKLEIKYDDDKLISPYIIGIKFINSGDIPIERRDFDSQLKIVFNENSKVIGHKFIKVKPKELELVSKPSNRQLSINPTLLNPGDAFIVEVLLDGEYANFNVSARISGIDGILEKQKVTKNGLYLHKVTSTGVSTSSHTVLLYFPTYVLLGIAFTCFLVCSSIDGIPEEHEHKTIFVAWVINLFIGIFATLFAIESVESSLIDSRFIRFTLTIFTWLTLHYISSLIYKWCRGFSNSHKTINSDP